MSRKLGTDRRDFLKSVAIVSASGLPAESSGHQEKADHEASTPTIIARAREVAYPRPLSGPSLAMVSFPLGGIGAGSIGLGGRGQLRDWEIFNCANKGNQLAYAFPSIWIGAQGKKPVAHVLEARIETPYEGQDGLGSNNVPGLSRLQGATFTGEFPAAHIDFHDDRFPLKIALNAGTPFIPLDADASGLPVAALHYRVRNLGATPASVSIAYSLENPVKDPRSVETGGAAHRKTDARVNDWRQATGLQGFAMSNGALSTEDVAYGSFAFAVLDAGVGRITKLTGWPSGRWWNSPLLFWDDFSSDGELGPEPEKPNAVGAVCLKQTIAPGADADFSFLLAWHFPNRTPARCGWEAPKGHEHTVIGNWYATKFKGAWQVAEYAAAQLPLLEPRTANFVLAMRESTLSPAIKEAAMSNLSTLVSPTCFRTADGAFHGFEGVDDKRGCCFGNCTHVWNYETATAHLFPSFSRSLRRSAFGYSMDERGAMYFRQLLPDGIQRFGYVAADGQMGQIIKVYLDWQLIGDREFLSEFWPKVKLAIEFAWIAGGWDANRDGVFEGVQHNTYDVEFYGPNPLCSIYYLGALRAAEEMARAAGDTASALEYRRVFESGRNWLDANLFNGEYYIQKVEGRSADSIARGLRSDMGADNPEQPQFQVGDGCLLDQLLGQYLADVCGLGALVDLSHIRKTLSAIYRYNHKPHLYDHENVQRTFALNDEAAMVICDYGKGDRPKIPFPYYAEVMTGLEYSTASLMLFRGMIDEGLGCIDDIRKRYDGVRRNPWNEAECGNHYARAMAAWSGVLALSGFQYRGADRHLTAVPRVEHPQFRSFWSTGTGWGVFSLSANASGKRFSLEVSEGFLQVQQLETEGKAVVEKSPRLEGETLEYKVRAQDGRVTLRFGRELRIEPGRELALHIRL